MNHTPRQLTVEIKPQRCLSTPLHISKNNSSILLKQSVLSDALLSWATVTAWPFNWTTVLVPVYMDGGKINLSIEVCSTQNTVSDIYQLFWILSLETTNCEESNSLCRCAFFFFTFIFLQTFQNTENNGVKLRKREVWPETVWQLKNYFMGMIEKDYRDY